MTVTAAFMSAPLQAPPTTPQRENHNSGGSVPSLLKWTGSKRSQAMRIAAYAPAYQRYYEPFVGGGALLYLMAKPGSVAADLYAPLTAFWTMVRDRPEQLIKNYTEQWQLLQKDLPGYFYIVRDRFNQTCQPEDLNFLMRTCVNGIVRFNKNGEFNNSFHLSRKGMLPARFASIVRAWAPRLQGIEIRQGDFEETLADAKKGDFVYLDPPYGGNKQRYINDLDLTRVYATLEDLNHRGIRWALSFAGMRGVKTYDHTIPTSIYRRKVLLDSGYSAISKVLNGPIEVVKESLYLNY